MNFFKRFFKGKKTLRGILEANNLTTDKTKYSTSIIQNRLIASNVKMKHTKGELIDLVIPPFNDWVGDDGYNDIELITPGKIIIKKTDYLKLKGFDLVISDFANKPRPFKIREVLASIPAIQMTVSSGRGKTVLFKRLLDDLKEKERMIFTTKPEDFGGEALEYTEENIATLKTYLTTWLGDRETKLKSNMLIILDEAFVLFSDKKNDELAEMINKVLAFNRAYNLRFFFGLQIQTKSNLGKFNPSLIDTKMVSIPDVKNYLSSLGEIPKRLLSYHLKRGEFYFFYDNGPAQVLKYSPEPRVLQELAEREAEKKAKYG